MSDSFGDRLATAFDARGSVCVGIDPHAYLLREWGLEDDANGLRDFGLRVVDAANGVAGIVKPQVAFFERHGSAGFVALEEVLEAARTVGLVVIADVKRGDIGSTVEAYAEAWLTPGSALEADAITLSAYQGVASAEAPLALAQRFGKGVFVLAATSNPEATALQTAVFVSGRRNGMTVAAGIVSDVDEWNSINGSSAIGSAGLVLGATVDFAEYGIDLDALARRPATPILAPGFGHQGARVEQLAALYKASAPYVVVSASRSILSAGPAGIRHAIATHASEAAAAWRK